MKPPTLRQRVADLERITLDLLRRERKDMQQLETLMNDFSVAALAMMLCRQKIVDAAGANPGPPN